MISPYMYTNIYGMQRLNCFDMQRPILSTSKILKYGNTRKAFLFNQPCIRKHNHETFSISKNVQQRACRYVLKSMHVPFTIRCFSTMDACARRFSKHGSLDSSTPTHSSLRIIPLHEVIVLLANFVSDIL